jgi:hypothetical protein
MRTLEIQRLHGGLAIIVNRKRASPSGAMRRQRPSLEAPAMSIPATLPERVDHAAKCVLAASAK